MFSNDDKPVLRVCMIAFTCVGLALATGCSSPPSERRIDGAPAASVMPRDIGRQVVAYQPNTPPPYVPPENPIYFGAPPVFEEPPVEYSDEAVTTSSNAVPEAAYHEPPVRYEHRVVTHHYPRHHYRGHVYYDHCGRRWRAGHSYYSRHHRHHFPWGSAITLGALGGIIGHQSGHRDEGILIGAGLGLLGGLLSH